MERDRQYEQEVIERQLARSLEMVDGGQHYPRAICNTCRHLYSRLAKTCAAFPRGIPEAILSGKHDHHHPFPGDNGIIYQAVDLPEDQKQSFT